MAETIAQVGDEGDCFSELATLPGASDSSFLLEVLKRLQELRAGKKVAAPKHWYKGSLVGPSAAHVLPRWRGGTLPCTLCGARTTWHER